MFNEKTAEIIGLGYYVPEKVVTNKELEKIVDKATSESKSVPACGNGAWPFPPSWRRPTWRLITR